MAEPQSLIDRVLAWAVELLAWDLGIPAIVAGVLLALLLLFPGLVRGLFAGRKVTEISFGFTGISLKLAAQSVQRANAIWGIESPDTDEIQRRLAALVRVPALLWVDDHPKSIKNEIEALTQLGYQIRVAERNDAALAIYRKERIDVVVSDIARRREGKDAGLKLPGLLAAARAPAPPVIYYVGKSLGPTTPGGERVTIEPLELFRLIGEALERKA
ncbi:MAG: response regulator [Alphaproteobacteria bacterium]|nr:response regulator [Alphaproteobacteria bacterium]